MLEDNTLADCTFCPFPHTYATTYFSMCSQQVTLDRVLEDNTLAELVTTGKLSGEAHSGMHSRLPQCFPGCRACLQFMPPKPLAQLCLVLRRPWGAELALLTLYLAYEKKRGKVGCA